MSEAGKLLDQGKAGLTSPACIEIAVFVVLVDIQDTFTLTWILTGATVCINLTSNIANMALIVIYR
jgi:hypothetical protein